MTLKAIFQKNYIGRAKQKYFITVEELNHITDPCKLNCSHKSN